MRGKVIPACVCVGVSGITPAYAGKSSARSEMDWKPTDHPRLCGEKACFVYVYKCALRITPAYAGKSQTISQSLKHTQDHPRLCGEKQMTYTSSSILLGSPPPMRGKVCVIRHQHSSDGITPAYAGKSMPAPPASMPARDHPRLCGEKYTALQPRKIRRGSPPPMRGKAPDTV